MSMREVIEQITEGKTGKQTDSSNRSQAVMSCDSIGRVWIACPYCSKRQFPIHADTKIKNMAWKCKGSGCRREMTINVG